jgi:hypothetical protein
LHHAASYVPFSVFLVEKSKPKVFTGRAQPLKWLRMPMRALVALCLLSSVVRANEPDPLHEFFVTERESGALLLNTGLTAGVLGAALRVQDSQIAQGASYAVFAVALVEIVGGVLLMNSQARERRSVAARERDPIAFAASERVRMKRIDLQYKLVEIFEGLVMATGVTLAGVGGATNRQLLTGAGLGLFLQGGVLLTLDLNAHRHARRYQRTLNP